MLIQSRRALVLRTLRHLGHPVTVRRLAEVVKLPRGRVQYDLQILYRRGQVSYTARPAVPSGCEYLWRTTPKTD